jgi:hypothetical protein
MLLHFEVAVPLTLKKQENPIPWVFFKGRDLRSQHYGQVFSWLTKENLFLVPFFVDQYPVHCAVKKDNH